MLLPLLGVACAGVPAPLADDELKFSGVVEAVDIGCYADGICYMTIDGRKVVFGMGWSREAWGEVAPMAPMEAYLGKRVNVYCRQRGEECWLVGNERYFIRPSR